MASVQQEGNPYYVADSTKIVILIVLALLCVIGLFMARSEAQTIPGQSLDAVRLSKPAFADGDYLMVSNRTTGSTWHLVQMRDGDGVLRWQVLEEQRKEEN